jgi:hypothetical protein
MDIYIYIKVFLCLLHVYVYICSLLPPVALINAANEFQARELRLNIIIHSSFVHSVYNKVVIIADYAHFERNIF